MSLSSPFEGERSKLREVYEREGYALLDFRVGDEEVVEVERYIDARVQQGHEGNIYDNHGNLRALHGYSRESGMLVALMSRLAAIAKDLLECDGVYVYQFRVNVKNGVADPGDTTGSWKPHRDFDYWQNMDGMREPRAVIFHMLVNRHYADNGPLEVCPGTHLMEPEDGELKITPESDWKAGFSEDIKYQIDKTAFSRRHIVPLHGDAGTLVAMHPKLWHGSSPNRTPEPRILLSMIFNDVDNAVVNTDRPEYVVQNPSQGTWW